MQDDTRDTFRIAEMLLNETDPFVQSGAAWALRTTDSKELLAFLDRHAIAMPGAMLSGAIAKLTPEQRQHYRKLHRGQV